MNEAPVRLRLCPTARLSRGLKTEKNEVVVEEDGCDEHRGQLTPHF